MPADAGIQTHVIFRQDRNCRQRSYNLADTGHRNLGRREEQSGGSVGIRSSITVGVCTDRSFADSTSVTNDIPVEAIRDVVIHVGDGRALSRIADHLMLGHSSGNRPSSTAVRIERHDAHRTVYLGEELEVHVSLVIDVAVEVCALIVDYAPAIPPAGRESDTVDFCSLGKLAHHLMAFVRDVAIEKRAVVIDDAPTVATSRRKRDTDDFCAIGGQFSHLLMAFVRDIAVEERAFVIDDAPTVAAPRRKRDADDLSAALG